jgi:hypothetical protein
MKRALIFISFVSLLLCLPAGMKTLTHGFRLAKMEFDVPSSLRFEEKPTEEVLSILSQPFHYLDRGAQCYVFSSKDDKYVIKLFRADPPTLNPFRLFWRKRSLKKKMSFETKIGRLFSACRIAAHELPDQTAVIYTHLNLTEGTLPTLKVTDPIGRRYNLPLDKYRFAVQKKAEPFRKTLKSARSDPIKMKQCLDSFYELLFSRAEKGIGNSDPTLSRNFGFLGGKAIEIDFGSYYPDPKLSSPEGRSFEMNRYLSRLNRWLKKNAPEWAGYLDQKKEIQKQGSGCSSSDQTTSPLSRQKDPIF